MLMFANHPDVGGSAADPAGGFHVVKVWHFLCCSFVAGIAQSFGGPAYSALIPTLVPKQDMPNAIALIRFSSMRL